MDMEKVLEDFEYVVRKSHGEGWDYVDGLTTEDGFKILQLLKGQEAQSVLSNRVCETEPFRYVRKGFCPKCHQEMEWLFNRSYCGFCGRAVKWE